MRYRCFIFCVRKATPLEYRQATPLEYRDTNTEKIAPIYYPNLGLFWCICCVIEHGAWGMGHWALGIGQ